MKKMLSLFLLLAFALAIAGCQTAKRPDASAGSGTQWAIPGVYPTPETEGYGENDVWSFIKSVDNWIKKNLW